MTEDQLIADQHRRDAATAFRDDIVTRHVTAACGHRIEATYGRKCQILVCAGDREAPNTLVARLRAAKDYGLDAIDVCEDHTACNARDHARAARERATWEATMDEAIAFIEGRA